MSWLERLAEKSLVNGTSGAVAKVAKPPLAPLAPTPPGGNHGIFADRLPAITDAQAEREETYGRVTCLRCSHLTRAGVCRAKSTGYVKYTPMQYQPVLLWRRCSSFKATS